MAMKLTPIIRLTVRALDAGHVATRPFALTDILSRMRRPATSAAGRTDSREQLSEVNNLQWWDLKDESAGLNTAGFTLAPQLVPRNTTSGSGAAAVGDAALFAFKCRGDYWTTVVPDYAPAVTALKWYNSDPDVEEYRATATQDIAGSQPWAVQLHTFGRGDADDAFLELRWADYVLRMAPGSPMTLAREVIKGDPAKRTLKVLRELQVQAEQFTESDPAWIRVQYPGGRLVVEIEQGRNRHQMVYTEHDPESGTMGSAIPKVARYKLGVCGKAVPFSLRVHEVQYADNGNFVRAYTQQTTTPAGDPVSATAFGHNPHPQAQAPGRGHAGLGQVAEVGAVGVAGVPDSGVYDCGLARSSVPGNFAMAAHSTPFVHGVGVRYGPDVAVGDTWYADITPAVEDITVEIADPGLQPGATLSARVRRDILPYCKVYNTGGVVMGTVGDAWWQYVNKYHDVELQVAWQYDDGSTGTYLANGTWVDFYRMFQGVVYELKPEQPGYGENHLQLECRDYIVRFQRPAGIIDERFGPADLLLHEKMAMVAPGNTVKLFGCEIVQYIVNQILGPSTGRTAWTTLRTILPDDHWDLLTYEALTNPPFGSGFFFPPPFGESALDWITKIAERDFAMFFFMYDSDVGQYVPCYMNWFEYIKRIADRRVLLTQTDLVDTITHDYGWQHNAAHDANVITVWGQVPQDQGDYRDLMPAIPLISGRARVTAPAVPENSPDTTWERTLVKQGTHFWSPGVAQTVATHTVALLKRADIARRYRFHTRGLADVSWGYQLKCEAGGLIAALDTFRVMRLTQKLNVQQQQWTTEIIAVPDPWS